MKRFMLICIVLVCGLLFPNAFAQQLSIKDSLLRIYINSPRDSNRLVVLHDIARLDQQTPTFIYYEDKLLSEATEQQNLYFQSLATYEHIIYYYNKFDQERLMLWMNRMENLAQKHQYYKDYFKAKKLIIETYTINQQIELAIHEANAMYKKAEKLQDRNGMREACLCLMTNYFSTLRYDEGVNALNRAFELMSPQDTPMEKVNALTKAVIAYSFIQDYDKMLTYLNKLKIAQEELVASSPTLRNAYGSFFIFLDIHYAIYYNRTNQPEKALEYLQKVDAKYTPNIFIPYKTARYNTYAEYYRLKKEYETSLAFLDSAIQTSQLYSLPDVINFSSKKADILIDMGRSNEALPIYAKAMKDKDSLYRALSTSQMEQIQSIYNMDKLLLEKEQRQVHAHYIYLALIIIALLILIIFVVRIYINQSKLKKDEQETRKLSLIAEEANEVKSRFLANMSYNIRIPLNNVVGFSQLLSTDTGLNDKERQEYSTIIQANSTELIQLVNDVLDLSRLEAKMMKFQIQECEMHEMCADIAAMAKMNSDGHINISFVSTLECQVLHTDANRFNQALMSMLSYPEPCDKDRDIKLRMDKDETKGLLIYHIVNSPLADPEFASQKVSVRHKINQLLFEYFGGNYQVSEDQEITFSIALDKC